ncbi:MAG: hypothetical protein ACKV22_22820, partial [Bryobacteraceae bacterium]
MTTVSYFSLVVPNKAGEGARILNALKEAGVNLIALWGYPVKGKKAQVDLVPEDAPAFQKAVKKLGIDPGKKRPAFLVSGEDRVGAIADAMSALAAEGISVWAAQAVSPGGG